MRPRKAGGTGPQGSRRIATLLCLVAFPALASAEEEVVEAGPSYEAPVPERRTMAVIRFAPGLSISPGQAEVARFDCDIAIGLRVDLTRGRAWLSLVPEMGYTYHNGDIVGGHYGTLGVGMRFGTNWLAFNPVAAVVLGERLEGFDIGVRAGARLLAALDLVGLEVSYEFRTLRDSSDDLHGIRVVIVFDIGVVFMPTLLTRFGYSFGRAE